MKCQVDTCERAARSRGYCPTHYQRWRRTGTDPDSPVRFQCSQFDDLPTRLEAWSTPDGACRIWTGHTNADGYPMLNWDGKKQFAHRLAYELANGPTDSPLDHLCSNRACIESVHLEAVSQAVNVQRGQLSKLMAEDVLLIRTFYPSGKWTQSELAEMFGVGRQTISNVVNRKTWRNVP